MDTQKTIVHRKRIGDLLVEAGILRRDQLPLGLKEAEQRSLRLGEVLVMLRYLSAEDLENVLQAQIQLEEGTVGQTESVEALRYASRHKMSFAKALEIVRKDADDKRAQYELELAIFTERLHDMERTRGPSNRDVGSVCLQIADLHADNSEVASAETYYQRALQIFERAFGRNHLKVAACELKLADLFFAQQRWSEAETLYWRVLDVTQDAWGEDHLQVAHCHQSLAGVMEAQGRLREAEQFYLSSLRIIEKVSGPDSPDMTDGLRHLSAFWQKQGKRPEHKRLGDLLSEAGLLTAPQVQAALAHSHRNGCPLGQALVQLSYITQEDLRPALQAQILIGDGVLPVQLAMRGLRVARQGKAFEEALRDLGWEPDVVTTEELKILIRTAEELVSAEAALGSEHAGVAVLSMKLADKYTGQKRYLDAEPLYKRAAAILEKSFGGEDSEVATALAKLAHLYVSDNKPADACPLIERALSIRQKVHGEVHMEIAECMDLLGLVHEKLDNSKEAERCYKTALNIKEELLGVSHERAKETLERLAGALFAQGKLPEAEEIYLRLVRSREKAAAGMKPNQATALQRLGEIYMDRKNYAEAERQFKQALEIHEKIDKSSLSAAELLEKFSFLLETTGRSDESRKMKERAQMVKRLRA